MDAFVGVHSLEAFRTGDRVKQRQRKKRRKRRKTSKRSRPHPPQNFLISPTTSILYDPYSRISRRNGHRTGDRRVGALAASTEEVQRFPFVPARDVHFTPYFPA